MSLAPKRQKRTRVFGGRGLALGDGDTEDDDDDEDEEEELEEQVEKKRPAVKGGGKAAAGKGKGGAAVITLDDDEYDITSSQEDQYYDPELEEMGQSGKGGPSISGSRGRECVQCPICSQQFEQDLIQAHAANCQGL